MEPLQTVYRPRGRLDLRATVGAFQRGPGDPTQRTAGGVIWQAVRTPEGVATLALSQQSDGSVRAASWGSGRGWAIEQVPALCGGRDSSDGFDASLHPLIADAFRRHPGLRLGRTDLPFDAFAQAVVEQKITLRQAFRVWRRIVTWHGDRAPGPGALFAPPSTSGWRTIPSWSWHRAGLEPPQSKTLVMAAARADAVERAARWQPCRDEAGLVAAHSANRAVVASGAIRPLAAAPPGLDEARSAGTEDPLLCFPGVGPWTAAETRIRSFGDPDAVSVGDYHLAHHVGHALTGSRVDDDGMLELLEPWRGHRQRVIRLILAAGAGEPRRAPRLHEEDHTAR
jgi:3-methyladenine DNA glycosylase/8-oxoguanine DNA glycosylase